MASALVDRTGKLLESSVSREATGAAERDLLVARLTAMVHSTMLAAPRGASVLGGGIGCAGPIVGATNSTECTNLPGFEGLDLIAMVRGIVAEAGLMSGIEAACDGGLVLVLDGQCSALAEAWLGVAREASSSMFVLVSTGVGGGIVLNGRLLRGKSGNCGHVGQIQVEPRKPGAVTLAHTLDQLASGPASIRWARSRGWTGTNGLDLGRDAMTGHPVAVGAVRRSATLVGETIASLSALLDLEVVAVGGGFSEVTSDYVDLVAGVVSECSFMPHTSSTLVKRSGLGTAASLIGAAAAYWTASGAPTSAR